jgi:hypothetical protein
MEQQLINILGAIVAVLIGWFIRILWEAQTKMRQDIDGLNKSIPETYVRRDDYRDDIRDIKSMLGTIFDRLETKASK